MFAIRLDVYLYLKYADCDCHWILKMLQFLTENTDFTVIGVIGPPGVGKSTIMNELYGFDSSSPGQFIRTMYFRSSLDDFFFHKLSLVKKMRK